MAQIDDENTETEEQTEASEEGIDAFLPVIPEELGIDPVLLGLLHTAAFLDLADDDSVDPEFAGDVLEHVGLYIQRLGPERASEIEAQLEKLGKHAADSGWPPHLREFVSDFLYNCGIGDEEDSSNDDE